MDCARVEDGDLVARYLAGRLRDTETESFEAHYFGCEACWAEVKAAGEIRAAQGVPVLAARYEPRPGSGRDLWTLLAAAAAVAVMVFGLSQLAQRPEGIPPQPVWRGSNAGALPLTITRDTQGQVALRWPAHPEAQVYVVEVFASDGTSVWKRDTSETNVTLDAGVLASSNPGISLLMRVEALDTMRQVVAKSEMTPLPQQ